MEPIGYYRLLLITFALSKIETNLHFTFVLLLLMLSVNTKLVSQWEVDLTQMLCEVKEITIEGGKCIKIIYVY